MCHILDTLVLHMNIKFAYKPGLFIRNMYSVFIVNINEERTLKSIQNILHWKINFPENYSILRLRMLTHLFTPKVISIMFCKYNTYHSFKFKKVHLWNINAFYMCNKNTNWSDPNKSVSICILHSLMLFYLLLLLRVCMQVGKNNLMCMSVRLCWWGIGWYIQITRQSVTN